MSSRKSSPHDTFREGTGPSPTEDISERGCLIMDTGARNTGPLQYENL